MWVKTLGTNPNSTSFHLNIFGSIYSLNELTFYNIHTQQENKTDVIETYSLPVKLYAGYSGGYGIVITAIQINFDVVKANTII